MSLIENNKRPNFKQMDDKLAGEYIWSFIDRYVRLSRSIQMFNETDQEDMLQEIFIDLFTNKDRYNHEIANYSTYASRAVDWYISRYIKNLKTPKNRTVSLQYAEGICSKDNPIGEINIFDCLKIINIDEKLIEIADMKYRQSMSVAEISEETGISAKDIYVKLKMIKTKAKKALEKEYD